MKKTIKRSMMFAFGASIFLFSEHVFANTVIYDPLDPKNTITPITEIEDSSGTIELQSAEEQPEVSTSNAISETNTTETTDENAADQKRDDQRETEQAISPSDPKREKEQSELFPPNDPYLPKGRKHAQNHVLILDEGFFSQENVVTPPDASNGGGSAPNDFSDIAQSAYLLSGMVLYGEANGKLEARVSDRFVG